MTAPGATGRRSAAARLTGIGLLAAGVAVALYLAGRLLTPNYNVSLFGRVGLGAVTLKSMLASIALGVAAAAAGPLPGCGEAGPMGRGRTG